MNACGSAIMEVAGMVAGPNAVGSGMCEVGSVGSVTATVGGWSVGAGG